MNKTAIVFMCLTVALALALVASLSQPAANPDQVVSIEEVTPGSETTEGVGVKAKEKTVLLSFLHWGPSPTKAISSIGEMDVDESGGSFAGFKTLKDAAKGPIILIVMGGLAFLAGIAVFIWVSKSAGWPVAAGGLVLMGIGLCVEAHPWTILLVPVLAFGAGVWFVFGTNRGKALREKLGLTNVALKETVSGVERYKAEHPDQREAVNASLLAAHENDPTSGVVDAIKTG